MLHGLENEISPIVTEWMGKELVCDIDVIKTADSKDLKRKNTQIYDLMPDIAEGLPQQEALSQIDGTPVSQRRR